MINVPTEEDLGLGVSHIVTHVGLELTSLFTSRLVMAQPLIGSLTSMRDMAVQVLTTQDQNTKTGILRSLMTINSTVDTVNADSLTVDKEIQFNDWLFAKIDALLTPKDFVVQPRSATKIYCHMSMNIRHI